jgi:Peroxisomal biogenesis factor 11 (PEX11)
VLRGISYIEVSSLVIYQTLENVTYLAANGVTGQALIKRTGGATKWTLWSIRAWLSYVLLQFVRLARESQLFNEKEEQRKKCGAEQQILTGGEKSQAQLAEEAEIEEAARQAEIRNWRQRLVSNAAWAPLCAHWSFESGIGVPASMTGFISLLAGVWGTYDAWQATAQ